MSKNKHLCYNLYSPSIEYMETVLGPWKRCNKKNCGGTLINIKVCYEGDNRIHDEYECSICGKTIRSDLLKNKKNSSSYNYSQKNKKGTNE